MTAPDWKRLLRREVTERLCTLERYRTDIQSRRIEGQLGGDQEYRGFAVLAFLLELSPHLDAVKAGAVIGEVDALLRSQRAHPCAFRPHCFPGPAGEVLALRGTNLNYLGVGKAWPERVLEEHRPKAGSPGPVLAKLSLPGGYRPRKDHLVVIFVDRDFEEAALGSALPDWTKTLKGRLLFARCDGRDAEPSWRWIK